MMNGIKERFSRHPGSGTPEEKPEGYRFPVRATLSSRPVQAASLLFLGLMLVLLTALALATWDEAVAMRVTYEILKALVVLVALGTVGRFLWRLSGEAVDRMRIARRARLSARLPEHQARLQAAASAAEDEARTDLARKILEDDGLFDRVKASELRRLRSTAKRMRPDAPQ